MGTHFWKVGGDFFGVSAHFPKLGGDIPKVSTHFAEVGRHFAEVGSGFTGMQGQGERVGLSTVYRTLQSLAAADMVDVVRTDTGDSV